MAANNDPFNWIMIKQIDDSNISSSSFPIAANVFICQVFLALLLLTKINYLLCFCSLK